MLSSTRSERCETCEWNFMFRITFQTPKRTTFTRNIVMIASTVTYKSFKIAWQLFCVVNRHIVFHMNPSCRSNFSIIHIRGGNTLKFIQLMKTATTTTAIARASQLNEIVLLDLPAEACFGWFDLFSNVNWHGKKMNASNSNACLCCAQDTSARWYQYWNE